MRLIQKLNSQLAEPRYFVPLLLGILIICFLVLTPKVSSTLFPQKREMILSDFIKNVQINHRINPQTFWEFREFYSPGYYTFARNGIPHAALQEILHPLRISISDATASAVLRFTSPDLTSFDILTIKKSLRDILNIQTPVRKVLYEDTTSKIFETNNNTQILVFLVPASEMKQANGFFDYQNVDKIVTDGKYWLNITKITTK